MSNISNISNSNSISTSEKRLNVKTLSDGKVVVVLYVYACKHIGGEKTYDFLAITEKEIGKEVYVNTWKGDTTAIVEKYKGTVEVPYYIPTIYLKDIPEKFIFECKRKYDGTEWNIQTSTKLERDISSWMIYNTFGDGKTSAICLRAFRAGMTSAQRCYVSWYYKTKESRIKIHLVSRYNNVEFHPKNVHNICELDEFGVYHAGNYEHGDTWCDYGV